MHMLNFLPAVVQLLNLHPMLYSGSDASKCVRITWCPVALQTESSEAGNHLGLLLNAENHLGLLLKAAQFLLRCGDFVTGLSNISLNLSGGGFLPLR